MTETAQEAYDRGDADGALRERLDGYDKHFLRINGSIEDTARELHVMAMAIQALTAQAVADARERVKTAEAVEKSRRDAASALESERTVRADRSATAWTPFARGATIIAAFGALLGIIAWFATRR